MFLKDGNLIAKKESCDLDHGNEMDEDDPCTHPPDPSSGKKRLACSNCRRRRKKCDLTYPCGNCRRLKLECNINEEDLRKKRYATSYVKSLEAHIAYLESSLKTLVDKVYPNDSQVLNKMMIGDVASSFISNRGTSKQNSTSETKQPSNEKPAELDDDGVPLIPSSNARSVLGKPGGSEPKKTFVKGSYYPEGPVSHKRKTFASNPQTSAPGTSSNPASVTSSTSSADNEAKKIASKERIRDLNTTVIVRSANNMDSLNNDPNILKSLSNFYKWLYPGHYIFLHRESFLYGFFNHSDNNYEDSNYCSIELIYAMCAVGSRLSKDTQGFSELYYEKSKNSLLQIVFDEQSVARITTVQAFLCLAFYELGKGDNQNGWYFSGLAIRVGYEMGFQLDPEVWITDDNDGDGDSKSKLTKGELEIRSRIYWGCYIADHLICLLLGRTSTLSVSHSTIPESDELPEVEGTQEFRFESQHVLQISLPLKNLIILSRIVQIFTSKIFIETDNTDEKVVYLIKFNLKVYNWRQSLPSFLKWSKSLIKDIDVSTDPTISYFWYYYYIVRLTLNKPFIEDCDESKSVVTEILDELKTMFNNFKTKFHGFKNASMFQLYACLLAIMCLKKLQDLDKTDAGKWEKELKFFQNVFNNELSPAFELPKRLQDDTEFKLDQEKQAITQVSNINYTHDFSLSNEIDDLIKELFGIENTVPL